MKKFYSEITDEFLNDFNALVNESDRILITSHFSPDDDSISSVMSLFIYLTENLKLQNVDTLYTGSKSDRWDYFPYYKNIQFVEDIADNISEYDLVIFVDGGKWDRFSNKEKPNKFPKTICIDHHLQDDSEFDLHLLLKDAPATAVIIYKLYYENLTELDEDICKSLLLGILGDTGGFRYLKPTQSETLLIGERLVREGKINIDEFQTNYNVLAQKVFLAVQELMKNTEINKIGEWPAAMTSYLSMEYVNSHGLNVNDVKEAAGFFTAYLRIIEGVQWGYVITPRGDGYFSVSFRSSPQSVNVRLIAEQMNGGGHDNAAGAKFETNDVNDVINHIAKWLEENEPTYE